MMRAGHIGCMCDDPFNTRAGGAGSVEERKVVLSITGKKDKEESEEVELVTEGTCIKDGDALILKYEESELSGMEGSTTVFTVENGRVTMERQGVFSSYCVLEQGRKFEGSYSTPAGSMRMGILPLRVESHEDKAGGGLDLFYVVDMGGWQESRQLNVNYRFSPSN